MNWDVMKGSWKEIRGKAQEQWGRLTNDDLDIIEGQKDQLVGKIQQRYGMTRDEAERSVREWWERSHV